MRTGIAHLPLHGGKAPAWLFQRMVRLARGITLFMLEEYDRDTVLERLSDPFWFQALGCVLGFDWHSSGLTTTTCGALKEGMKGLEEDTGLFFAGDKGATSRKTPSEIMEKGERSLLRCEPGNLVYASRMSAKVDSNALQDGFQIYHHFFVFTAEGAWAVVQQGMNETTGYARRYHWLSRDLSDFVCEPHTAICSETRGLALNLTAGDIGETRQTVAELSAERPDTLRRELEHLQTLDLPRPHQLYLSDLKPSSVERVLLKTYERQPEDFVTLLGMQGVGAKTLRALALIADLVHGTPLSWEDPAKFSFAHGGKDGHPYPVDRDAYEDSIQILERALACMKLEGAERRSADARLRSFLAGP